MNPDLLKAKKHFEILAGLRGIAAQAIVAFHFMGVQLGFFLPGRN
jgi:peptidoglycan/LPS O-acetylase OafA/YrhL